MQNKLCSIKERNKGTKDNTSVARTMEELNSLVLSDWDTRYITTCDRVTGFLSNLIQQKILKRRKVD